MSITENRVPLSEELLVTSESGTKYEFRVFTALTSTGGGGMPVSMQTRHLPHANVYGQVCAILEADIVFTTCGRAVPRHSVVMVKPMVLRKSSY